MLGAEGAWIGSAFLASEEADIFDHQKQAIIDATEEGTVISRSITGKPARIIRSVWTDFWERSELDPLPMPFQSGVAGQFSGAGRTPGSPLSQATVTGQVAQKALPYAFGQLERERGRQLQTAQRVPSLTAVGGALEDIQAQQQMAPQQALSQYYNTVAPIAFGLPTQQQTTQAPPPNAMGMAGGGAMMGAAMGNMMVPGGGGAMYGAALGGLGGLLGGLL